MTNFNSAKSNRKRTRITGDNILYRNLKYKIMRWRSENLHRNYSSKLIEALRQKRRSSYSLTSSSSLLAMRIAHGRNIRDTADRILAVTAKGKTRWSRAILASRRLRIKTTLYRKNMNRVNDIRKNRLPKPKAKKVSEIKKKARILGRLVPGCKKLSFPNLLDEASDYIAALEMQVRTMASLTEFLTGTPANLPGDGPNYSD